MDPVVVTYAVYLAISIVLTIWVAQTLFTNGRVFLVDIFRGNEGLADSVNHLLVVGFYLINLGFVVRGLRIYGTVLGIRGGVETVADKIGGVLLTLGFMHFFNLFVFSRIRRRTRDDAGFNSPHTLSAMPPVDPDFSTTVLTPAPTPAR